MQTNNYQGILVTDGLSSYLIFTYVCGEMQWSALGQNRAAVVGYNTGSFSFYNHPLSGFSLIGENISCTSESGRRQKRQTVNRLGNTVIRPTNDGGMMRVRGNCLRRLFEDQRRFTNNIGPADLASMLNPCPCSHSQARNDGHFDVFSQTPLCYVSVPTSFTLNNNEIISLTQECCYNAITGYVTIIISCNSNVQRKLLLYIASSNSAHKLTVCIAACIGMIVCLRPPY